MNNFPHSSAESRLLRATLQDFGQTMPINRRTAQLQAEQQIAQRAAQIKVNQETGQTVGSRTKYDQPFQAAPKVPIIQPLKNFQNVYTNKAAGLDSMATGTPGASVFDQRTVTATNTGLQKRIEKMRNNGMSEAQIAQEIQKGRDTMSTIPESTAVQNKIDAAAESIRKQRDNLVQSGFSIDPAAWAQAEQEARIAAAEEANAKAAAQAAEEARQKSYTPTVDPNANAAKIEMENTKNTITQDLKGSNDYIDKLDSSLANLSPLLQEAGKSFISYAKGRAADLQQSFEAQLAFVPTEEEITAQYAGQEADIRKNKELLLGIADRNKQLQEDIAKYNRDMMLADKAMIEHENNAALFKQAKANTDNERKLRRQLGRLGLNTDVQSLQYLDQAIQEGQTIYDNLRVAGDLSLIKANLAIGQGYMLDMTKAINDHDSAVATILANAEQELKTVKNAIGTAKSDRLKTIRDLIGKREEKKADLESKLADKIFELNKEMNNNLEQIKRFEAEQKAINSRLEYQERMSLKKLEYSEKKDDLRAVRQQVSDETKEAKQVRAAFTTAEDQPEVKNYITIRDAYNKAKESLDAAIASGKKIDIGIAKEIATVLHEKALDPSSVVREGEYLRASKGQGWFDNVTLFANSVANGDRTGITVESAQAFIEAMERSTETQRTSAMSRYVSALNYLQSFNSGSDHINVDPRTVAIPTELLRPEDLTSFLGDNNASYDYNYSAYSGNQDFTYQEDPKVTAPLTKSMSETGLTMDQIFGDWDGLKLMSTPQSQTILQSTSSVGKTLASLAPITQNFDTPISTKNYKASTVAAWGGKHDGLDLAFSGGTFIPSVTDGVLESVEYNKGGWGLTAVVRAPDGAEIRYSHLASIDPSLKIGMPLVRGREFAQVGNTGNVFSTSGGDGTHLDFRIKKDGKYIDPFSYYS